MEEICIKLDVPKEFRREFKSVLTKIVQELVDKLELAIAEEIVSKSKFTEKDADELSDKVKASMHLDLVKRGLS